jgi:hypothetical protein
MYKIDDYNKEYIIERYVNDIISKMHFLDIKSRLKNYLLRDKHNLSLEVLETEIMRHDPKLLSDIYIEETTTESSGV